MGLTATEKQGFESYFIHGDFSEVMETGETIDVGNSTVTVLDAGEYDISTNPPTEITAPEDATDTVTDQGTIAADGMKLKVRIRGGDEAGSPYHITFRIVTSIGNKWEVDGQIKIKEK